MEQTQMVFETQEGPVLGDHLDLNPTHEIMDEELLAEMATIPDKMAFKIGEAATFANVKSYVLRYWETEFEILKPKKSKNNQRMYSKKDLENVLLIKKLLYKDRYSIEGARHVLKRLRKDGKQVQKLKDIAGQMKDIHTRMEDLLDKIAQLRSRVGH